MRYKTKKYIRSGNSLEFQKGFTVVNVSPLVAVSEWAKNALFILLDLGKWAENAVFKT